MKLKFDSGDGMTKARNAAHNVHKVVADTQLAAARTQSDTIRLWENYNDQALLWRSLTLIQIPTTLVAIIFAWSMWSTREITLSVPSKPLPGMYAAQDIPDTEFINVATDYVNLIATYQPVSARKQFEVAAGMLKEPLLTKFRKEMLESELAAIESSSRTQVFFVDPLKTAVSRSGSDVTVSVTGERWKVVAGAELPAITSRFMVTMTTIPRNQTNPYGIVIKNVISRSSSRGERGLDTADEKERK